MTTQDPDRIPLKVKLGIGALAALLVGVAITAVFSVCGQWSTREMSSESRDWPRTQGTIISSRLRKSSGYRSSTTCTPDIAYRYEVNGVPLIGHRVAFHQWTCGQAQDEVNLRSAGNVVEVWYQPGEPAVSVLRPDSWDDDGFLLFTGLASVAIVLVVLPFVGFPLLVVLPPSVAMRLLAPLVAWSTRRWGRTRYPASDGD